jgi:hypothetical protein
LLGSAVMMSCIIELCEWIPFAGFGCNDVMHN